MDFLEGIRKSHLQKFFGHGMLMSGGQLARHFVYATMGLFEVLI
jgi:hypothetical protein